MKCELCAVYKSSGPEPRAPLHPIRATYPFERVAGQRNGPLEQPGRVPGQGWDSSRRTDSVEGHSISPAWGTWYRDQGNAGLLEDAGKDCASHSVSRGEGLTSAVAGQGLSTGVLDTDGLLASKEGPSGVSGGTQGLNISDTPELSTLDPIGVGVLQTSPPRRARVPRAPAWHKD
ncbi:hypothetical protein SRHO_G00335520 [Serrasalmus rhombeus]